MTKKVVEKEGASVNITVINDKLNVLIKRNKIDLLLIPHMLRP